MTGVVARGTVGAAFGAAALTGLAASGVVWLVGRAVWRFVRGEGLS